jgi:hypothetical protein
MDALGPGSRSQCCPPNDPRISGKRLARACTTLRSAARHRRVALIGTPLSSAGRLHALTFTDPFGLCERNDYVCQLGVAGAQALGGVLGLLGGEAAGSSVCGPAAPACAVTVAPAIALSTAAITAKAFGAAADAALSGQPVQMARAGKGRGSNQNANDLVRRIAKDNDLNAEGRDALHRAISKKGYTEEEIRAIAEDLGEQAKYMNNPPPPSAP